MEIIIHVDNYQVNIISKIINNLNWLVKLISQLIWDIIRKNKQLFSLWNWNIIQILWAIYLIECGFKRETLKTIIHVDNYQVNIISKIINNLNWLVKLISQLICDIEVKLSFEDTPQVIALIRSIKWNAFWFSSFGWRPTGWQVFLFNLFCFVSAAGQWPRPTQDQSSHWRNFVYKDWAYTQSVTQYCTVKFCYFNKVFAFESCVQLILLRWTTSRSRRLSEDRSTTEWRPSEDRVTNE